MSKAILVLPEMPESCMRCPLEAGYYICAVSGEETHDYSEDRPDWCQLRPMPEYEGLDSGESWVGGYKTGWNDALDAIGGSREDA